MALAWTFIISYLKLRKTIRVSNSLDQIQARHNCVRTICKSYHQTTLGDKVVMTPITKGPKVAHLSFFVLPRAPVVTEFIV